jgi:membrane-associated protein
MNALIDFILHFDKHLAEIIAQYGSATYAFLFAIVFCETGIVFLPFLPGDSLLFAAGAMAGAGLLNVWVLAILLLIAAITGDTVNYHLGKWFGRRMPLVREHHIEMTEQYFRKYGGKTVILARFIPIVRTLAPFVAGMGAMNYRQFILYNVVGGFVWVFLFLFAGYLFGSLPWVKSNFKFIILAIIFISVLPMAWEMRHMAFNFFQRYILRKKS